MSLTPRGFIKDVGGTMRMRFVKAGYDADDFGIPFNAVILDSGLPAAFGVYQSGTWPAALWPTSLTRVVTWVNPGYIPLVVCNFITSDGRRRSNGLIGVSSGGTSYPNIMVAKADGLYIQCGTSTPIALGLDYIAYAVPT